MNDDRKVQEDRMGQFLNMLSFLQDAHTRLATQLEQPKGGIDARSLKPIIKECLNELQAPKSNHLLESIHQTLISYLPLNLESQLNEIKMTLGQRSPSSGSNADLLGTWQQDIMSRHATIEESLDSIQHTLARVVDCLDMNGLFNQGVKPKAKLVDTESNTTKLNEIKEVIQKSFENHYQTQIQKLTMERDELRRLLNQQEKESPSVFQLVGKPLFNK